MTNSELQLIWEKILQNIQQSLSEHVCQNIIKPLKPLKLTDTVFELSAKNLYAKNLITRYIPFLRDSCYEVTKNQVEIVISIAQEQPNDEDNQKELINQQLKQFKQRNRRNRTKKKAIDLVEQPTLTEAMENETSDTPVPINPGDKSSLNPKYTFDTFVIGNSNSFAHAAALAVAENPAKNYNPFFMYGGVGLGKTHLMHAIGHKILQNQPQKRVLYISSEKFINELINSIKDGSPEAFRQKYRNVDVLLVDDIQFLANKERVQEEFFHTFNALKDADKQIILSSDRPPKEIEKLQDRLCSRFEGGLIADVQAPDLETRIAILKKKSTLENYNVPDDVMAYIASHIDNNVRELEGALTQVVARASFCHYPITSQFAMNVLQNIIKATPAPDSTKTASINLIQETVAKYFKITIADLNGKKRNRNIAFPRQIAMYLCRELTTSSLPKIGKTFGGRDHTTVMHACDKIKKQYIENMDFAKTVDNLRHQINQR